MLAIEGSYRSSPWVGKSSYKLYKWAIFRSYVQQPEGIEYTPVIDFLQST